MNSFIQVTEEKCSCCEDTVTMYHVPLPQDEVSYLFGEGFMLHVEREELQTLFLEIKGHLMALADGQPMVD